MRKRGVFKHPATRFFRVFPHCGFVLHFRASMHRMGAFFMLRRTKGVQY